MALWTNFSFIYYFHFFSFHSFIPSVQWSKAFLRFILWVSSSIFTPFCLIQLKTEYRPVHKKYDSSKLKNFINEKFKKIFNFFTCILPNNVAHDITKEFWKNSHFENMTAVFFWAVKTDFGKLPLKKSIFRDDKNISSSILPR